MPAPLLILTLLSAAPESPNPFVGQAKTLYQKLEFEKCLMRLEQAGRWDNTKRQLAEIELYAGLCTLGLGNEKEALERMEMALKLDRGLELPSLVSPKVSKLFDKVRAKLGPAPAEPPEPPPTPPPAVDAPTEAKLVPKSDAPPAVLQPTEKPVRLAAPLAFGAVGVAAAIAGGVLGSVAKSSETAAQVATYESDAVAIGHRAQNEALAANLCFGLAGAAAVTAIIIFLVQN